MTAPSLEDLLLRHRARIDRVAFAYGKGAAEREEIAQAIAVQVWRSMPRLDPTRPEAAFVYRVALNVAIAHARAKGRRTRSTADLDVEQLASRSSPEPKGDLERLRACLDEFDGLDRALLLLWLDGEDHASIGAILGLSTTNVGTKLHRNKQRLRDAYDRLTRRHDREPDDHGTH